MLSIALALLAAPMQESSIVVDSTRRTPISPYVYGVNNPEWDGLGRGFTLARQGGNRMTAYNWETNASNAGNDWHHQNDNYLGVTDEAGWTERSFMRAAQAHGAAALLTVPTQGHVAADKKGDGDVNKTPDYLDVRFLRSYARKPGGRFTYPPNVHDRAVYQDEFVAWIEKVKSPKTPVWFSLDNEPDLWQSTHARIQHRTATYAEIIANNIEYASAIKAVAPRTMIFGPASYGWQGFRRFQDASDARGRDFLDVYLAAMNDAGRRAHRRLLDVLDIHWYPEAKGGGVRITDTGNAATAAARVQAPRSLWDPTYVEDSWIAQNLSGKPIALLPGIQAQIRKQYPGTKLAITEYNYGGGRDVSGLIAQADVLGLFGRYGLFAACNWGVVPRDTAQVAGYKAFIDYDRRGSRFGDLGLPVSGTSASANSVYASIDSKNPRRMTIVAINKTGSVSTMRLTLKGFAARNAKAYTVGSSLGGPSVSKPAFSRNVLRFVAPPMSVSTIEIGG